MNIGIDIRLKSKKVALNISEIVVPAHFKNPNLDKILMHHQDYICNGYLDPIIVDSNNVIIDGYISYLIHKGYGHEKVDVYKIYTDVRF